jgi:hypothetical protein
MLSLPFLMAMVVRYLSSLHHFGSPYHHIYSFLLLGSSVAKYAGQHVAERLASDSAYLDGDYKTAMKRAFLGTDEDLRAGEPPRSIPFHPSLANRIYRSCFL